MFPALDLLLLYFFFSSRRRHTRWTGDWSSDVCSSDLEMLRAPRFWGDRPGFDRIVFRNVPDPGARVEMIRSAQAQVAEGIPPESVDDLQRAPGISVVAKPALRTFGMG